MWWLIGYGVGYMLTLFGIWLSNQYDLKRGCSSYDVMGLGPAVVVAAVWPVGAPVFGVVSGITWLNKYYTKRVLWKPKPPCPRATTKHDQQRVSQFTNGEHW